VQGGAGEKVHGGDGGRWGNTKHTQSIVSQ
jgi:hypothetical protein